MEKPDVVIIQPGHKPLQGRKSLPPSLSAPYLAGLISIKVNKIEIVDLAVKDFQPINKQYDIALLTTTMAQSNQIFFIAEKLKEKGATIILGGPHVTLARDFDDRIHMVADSIIIGEGETSLPKAIDDYMAGALQKEYFHPINSLKGVPFSRVDLLDEHKYYTTSCLIATRGCSNNCEYCSIKDIYGKKYLKRDVDEVIEEIKWQISRPNISFFSKRLIEFWDDNPACDIHWFANLLEKMIPLKIKWLSQMCLNIAEHQGIVKLMKQSGCAGIFCGIESVSLKSLSSQNKDQVNIVSNYIRHSNILRKHNINLIGAFMFGFDEDTEKSLIVDTLQFSKEMGLTLMQCHIVTPYPHSAYFKLLKKEKRLITLDPKYYNGYTVVHVPKKISPNKLQSGFITIREQFYSWRNILVRMTKHNVLMWPSFLIWNFIFKKPNYQTIIDVDIKQWESYLDEKFHE